MERLTTDKKATEMGMCELAHNCCYIKDGLSRYRDFEIDMDARDFARNLMTTLVNEDMSLDDELFDDEIMENLIYDQFSDVKGLIALLYRNLWAMSDLREHLKSYEDAEETGLLIRPKCRLGNIVYALWSIPTEARYVIYPAEVKEISLSSTNARKMIMYKLEPIFFRGRYNKYYDDDFGKLVFLTESEAEQALAKREGV